MWWFGRQLSWIPGRGWKIPFYLSGVQSLSPLPVSEEHGCKGPEFASWVTACLVSPNFAWHALNYLQKNCTDQFALWQKPWPQLWTHICINSGFQLWSTFWYLQFISDLNSIFRTYKLCHIIMEIIFASELIFDGSHYIKPSHFWNLL